MRDAGVGLAPAWRELIPSLGKRGLVRSWWEVGMCEQSKCSGDAEHNDATTFSVV